MATFLAVGPLGGVFLIWAATISWAAYFALGGDDKAAINTVRCSIFGVFVATYAAYEAQYGDLMRYLSRIPYLHTGYDNNRLPYFSTRKFFHAVLEGG
jgi:hypothetical protein